MSALGTVRRVAKALGLFLVAFFLALGPGSFDFGDGPGWTAVHAKGGDSGGGGDSSGSGSDGDSSGSGSDDGDSSNRGSGSDNKGSSGSGENSGLSRLFRRG